MFSNAIRTWTPNLVFPHPRAKGHVSEDLHHRVESMDFSTCRAYECVSAKKIVDEGLFKILSQPRTGTNWYSPRSLAIADPSVLLQFV
jgi:hypothetical protein